MIKLVLSVFIVGLWLTNSYICDLIYPLNTEEHIRGWWLLRANIYAIIVALSFQTALISENNKLVRFVLNIGTGLAFSNVVDRWFFNVREFRKEDYLMIGLTLAFAIYDYRNGRK